MKWAIAADDKITAGFALSHASRARVFNYRHPGVPLRSTPGFMLAPAARVLERQADINLFRVSLVSRLQTPRLQNFQRGSCRGPGGVGGLCSPLCSPV